MNSRCVYFDNAASTPLDPGVVEVFNRSIVNNWANSSSLHSLGQSARACLDESRVSVAGSIGCSPSEVVFTSCATESNNLALRSTQGVVLSSLLDHDSVFVNSAKHILVNSDGFVNLKDLSAKLSADISMVSIVLASNEIGTIQPVSKIVKIVKSYNPSILVHTDASQAPQYINLSVRDMNIDMMTLSAQKIYSYKGCGCLYVRDGIKVSGQLLGGGHERGRRSGTENVPAISAFAKALNISQSTVDFENSRQVLLRDFIIESLSSVEGVSVNGFWQKGDTSRRLANNISLTIANKQTQDILTFLDLQGFCVSGGSACHSGSVSNSSRIISSVQTKLGATLRISLGRFNTKSECESFVSVLKNYLQ